MNYQVLKEIKWSPSVILIIFFLKHNYDDWLENETSIDTIKESDKEESINLSVIPSLEK